LHEETRVGKERKSQFTTEWTKKILRILGILRIHKFLRGYSNLRKYYSAFICKNPHPVFD